MTETHFDANAALKLGQDVLSHEADAILAASRRIGETPDFAQAVKAILGCRGRKLAATFASTGTPAFFVHAGEAAHGDLGMITSEDIVLGISYSGETQELLMIVPILKREGAILIAMTGNPESTLAQHADLHINCHVDREACPLNLAPTSSTTTTLALGDALAVACLSAKGFSQEDLPVAIRAEHSGADCSSMCGTLCAQETNCLA